MRPDIEITIERVISARERLARLAGGDVPVQEFEDALSEGHAQALAAEAWPMRMEHRLWNLIDDAARPVVGRELRNLTHEHVDLQRVVLVLRHDLDALRRRHDRVRRPRAA